MQTVTLDRLNQSSREEFVAALGDTFERAPWVAEAAFAARPFRDADALFGAMQRAIEAAGAERQMALIKAHPDLAGKAARAGALTAESAAEQTGAGLDRLSEAQFAAFHRLNDAYGKRFGFPFVICVRRHGVDSILRQFELRLANPPDAERRAALDEILRIGALRLDGRVAAPGGLKVHGRLSTHVLDTHAGRPAAGVALELFELVAGADPRPVARAATDAGGRTDPPLIHGRPVPIARYELRFAIGAYFAASGAPQSDPPFLDVVPIRFAVAEPEGHYHVPLLVTPWSYSTYRGS